MAFEFKLPDIGEGIHEGEIVEWLVAEGDTVEEDQDIVEVMTDKATVTISSPRAGTVQTLHFGDGDVVDVGEVIVSIQEEGGAEAAPTDAADEAVEAPEDGGDAATEEAPEPREQVEAPAPSNGGRKRTPRHVLAAPSVRIEARKRGIDIAGIEGSGRAGRVLLEDLEDAPEPAPEPTAKTPAPTTATGRGIGSDFTVTAPSRDHVASVEPVAPPAASPRATAARSATLQSHFAYVLPVQADALLEAVDEAGQRAGQDDLEVGHEALIIKALAAAVGDHPRCNALVEEESGDLVVAERVHVSVALPTDQGLRRVVVANADEKSVLEIARDLAQGGSADVAPTLSVTLLGTAGGIASTPILEHPQVTAVELGGLRQVAVLEDGQARAARELTLSFSFDHRYVDGYDGALYAQDVAELLDRPSSMLLASR